MYTPAKNVVPSVYYELIYDVVSVEINKNSLVYAELLKFKQYLGYILNTKFILKHKSINIGVICAPGCAAVNIILS